MSDNKGIPAGKAISSLADQVREKIASITDSVTGK
jgi:uncharacterized protein YoaH (UPF0181 family)